MIQQIRHSEIFAASIFPTSSPLSNLNFWPILHHFTDCSQPSRRDTAFTPLPVSDPTPPRHCSKLIRRAPRNCLPLPRDCPAWSCTTSSSLWFGFGGCAEGLRTNGVDEIVLVAFDDADEGDTRIQSEIDANIESWNGVDSGTIAAHLMKMPLDTPPDMHSPLRLIDSVPSLASTIAMSPRLAGFGCLEEETREAALERRQFLCDGNQLVGIIPAARTLPATWTKTIEISGEKRDLLLVCAGMSETDQSMLTIDRIILASESSSDQNFVFTTLFFSPSSAFPKTPIGVVACTVVVENEIVHIGQLDGDELRPFWTYRKVSELALDLSDAEYEVEPASGRICRWSVALLGRLVFMFGGRLFRDFVGWLLNHTS
ncbi:hypothetical protein BLNAU_9906 [Blattamonas nauphoetae]|uniref:Uncharacterized protein n=1 Tax=Blattamonas nauphoetae TaxID=2049346 RepID=A0ABQ9XUL7_9EUKA|nr:hypothetical protein BLNAU_9906 [Blattamonas nauphoetae]